MSRAGKDGEAGSGTGSAAIRLREIERKDLPVLGRWRADRDLAERLAGPFRFVGPDAEAAWFERYLATRDGNVRLAICRPGADEPVGVVYLLGIDRVARACEFAIMIGSAEDRGRGIGLAATRLALRHAFEDLNLHRVFLTVLAGNAAARLYGRVGFRVEGRLREAAFKSGRYHDLVVMGLLNSEFDASRTAAP